MMLVAWVRHLCHLLFDATLYTVNHSLKPLETALFFLLLLVPSPAFHLLTLKPLLPILHVYPLFLAIYLYLKLLSFEVLVV